MTESKSLPDQGNESSQEKAVSRSTQVGSKPTPKAARKADPFLRPANEDDDGYDPYSDRPVYTPLFEEDPWR